jgi:capsule biosynthesis phosphatase
MRIVIDLDGTICTLKQKHETYADVLLKPGAVEFIKKLRTEGHYIIIQTARNMATCESNVGKVMKNVGKVTLEWLEKNDVEYDEIFFGKPNAHLYIDDRAFRFEDWQNMNIIELANHAKEK